MMSGQIIPFSIQRQDERPRGYRGHCVYIIASKKDNIVKIGFSSDPIGRLASLQTGRPHELRIICLVPGSQCVERDFHIQFKRSRVGGEWFNFRPEMMTFHSKASLVEMRQPRKGESVDLIPIISGFCRLEDIDKIKAVGGYAEQSLSDQQHLLTSAIIGHVQKAIACISELRGISLAEASEALVRVVPLVNENSPAPDERVFPRPNTQVGFLFGEMPRGAA